MADNKKYYWFKLKEDFFDDKYIKALRKLPDGDALCIIYQKMQLKSLKTEGFIQYDKILPSAEEELALILDEDLNKVKLTLQALLNMGLVERWENDTFYMVAMQNLIGSETAVAERVRKHREKQKTLQCNTKVTNSNTYIEIEKRENIKELDINISAKAEPKQTKKSYGEYGRVKLTENQYKKLCEDFNKDVIDNQIMLLDEYVESNNNKNKYSNFNLVLRKSIREGWFKKKENKMIQTKKEIVPDWFDKETEIEPMSPETQKRMEDLIKELQG